MDNSELTCISCKRLFIPLCTQQQCCTYECAREVGRHVEYPYVMEALDDMHRKAWAQQVGKTYE